MMSTTVHECSVRRGDRARDEERDGERDSERGAERLPRVLVVDDNPLVRRGLMRGLGGYEVVEADGALDALDRLASDSFDVVISDVMMPGFDGLELLDAIAERHPEMVPRFVFLTGGVPSVRLKEKLERCGVPILDKPVSYVRLRHAVAEAATGRR